jgi:hypothetical protein
MNHQNSRFRQGVGFAHRVREAGGGIGILDKAAMIALDRDVVTSLTRLMVEANWTQSRRQSRFIPIDPYAPVVSLILISVEQKDYTVSSFLDIAHNSIVCPTLANPNITGLLVNFNNLAAEIMAFKPINNPPNHRAGKQKNPKVMDLRSAM